MLTSVDSGSSAAGDECPSDEARVAAMAAAAISAGSGLGSGFGFDFGAGEALRVFAGPFGARRRRSAHQMTSATMINPTANASSGTRFDFPELSLGSAPAPETATSHDPELSDR